jgi:glucose dehydrogenase
MSVVEVRWLTGVVVAIVVTVAVSATLAEQTGASPPKGETEWRFFGSDNGATRYSPANQIDAGNVKIFAWPGAGRRGTLVHGRRPRCRSAR